jgi:hypothetical protein
MKVWTCGQCKAWCEEKIYHYDKVVQVDGDKYCHRFFNPKAEPFYSEKGKEEWNE